MYALDTNSLIYFFKGMGRVGARLLSARTGQIAVPSVVLFELETGLAKSASAAHRRRQLDELLRTVRLLPFAATEAREAAGARASLERAGQQIGPFDVLIAGTALAHRATLVTRNVREFSRVPGLVVEDWY